MVRGTYFTESSGSAESGKGAAPETRFGFGAYWHSPARDAVIKQFAGDVAVLLMIPVWETELGGNRLQVARVLSQHMPTILVQPAELDPYKEATLSADRRLPNCWVLRTRYATGPLGQDIDEVARHLHDIKWALAQFEARRPIYWLFNPNLARLFLELNDGSRLFHATEDWYRLPRPAGTWLDKSALAASLEAADLVVAVSRGVSLEIRQNVRQVEPMVETNGCYYDHFANADAEHHLIADLRKHCTKVAVFCGTIDNRLRFDLLVRLLQEPALGLVLIGPVAKLESKDAEDFAALRQHPRVLLTGPMKEAEVARAYKASDVGIIPYRSVPHLVCSAFPSKLLEMAASQLPIVTSRMDSSKDVARAIRVCDSDEEFLSSVGSSSRRMLHARDRAELTKVARQNDYTAKFQRVLRRLAAAGRMQPGRHHGNVTEEIAAAVRCFSQGQHAVDGGRLIQGRRLLATALRALRMSLGRHHLTARKALAALGRTLHLMGRHVPAVRFMRASLGVESEMTPSYRIWRVETCLTLAAALDAINRPRDRTEALRCAWTDSVARGFHAGYSQNIGMDYATALLQLGDVSTARAVMGEIEQRDSGSVRDESIGRRIVDLRLRLDHVANNDRRYG